MERKPETRIKLVIDIPLEMRNEIKKRAINKNVTLKVWVLRAIFQQIALEKQYE